MPDSRTPQPDQPRLPDLGDRLSAYFDGQLSVKEQSAIEGQLVVSELLAAECELQNRIDASLACLFAVPDLSVGYLDQAIHWVSLPTVDRNRRRRLVSVAIAACLAWLAVGWVAYFRATDDGYQHLALQDIYQQCVSHGFEPDWVCEDDDQFAGTFQRRQGQALLLGPIPEGEMVGLAYLSGLSRNATTMLARVEGEPVLVFVDRLSRDPGPTNPSWWSGLQLFRKELAGLVMYEVTPLSEPRVMDAFFPCKIPVPLRH